MKRLDALGGVASENSDRVRKSACCSIPGSGIMAKWMGEKVIENFHGEPQYHLYDDSKPPAARAMSGSCTDRGCDKAQ